MSGPTEQPQMVLTPGPWASYSPPQKAWMWMRHRLLTAPYRAFRCARYAYHYWWTERAVAADESGDKDYPDLGEVMPHPRIMLPILWRWGSERMGKYSTVTWEHLTAPSQRDGGG